MLVKLVEFPLLFHNTKFYRACCSTITQKLTRTKKFVAWAKPQSMIANGNLGVDFTFLLLFFFTQFETLKFRAFCHVLAVGGARSDCPDHLLVTGRWWTISGKS